MILSEYKKNKLPEIIINYMELKCKNWNKEYYLIMVSMEFYWTIAKHGFVYNPRVFAYYNLSELKPMIGKNSQEIYNKIIISFKNNKIWHYNMDILIKKAKHEKIIYYNPWWSKQKQNYLNLIHRRSFRLKLFELVRDFPEEIPSLEYIDLTQF